MGTARVRAWYPPSQMTNERKENAEGAAGQLPSSEPAEKPTVTVETIKSALRRAAPGADQLNDDLREVFELSDSSAMLRLR